MRVNEVLLGDGLIRLDVEPTCFCERNIPTHVVDNVMRDIIKRKNANRVNDPWGHRVAPQRGFAQPRPQREPDGIDIHVDRPLRENFCSQHGWADAMAKYRTLEHLAKDCNWPCKEPMKGTQQPQQFAAPRKNTFPRPMNTPVAFELNAFVNVFEDDDDCGCPLGEWRVW